MDVPLGNVPRLLSPQATFAPLSGGTVADFWSRVEPVVLREVTTGDPPVQATRVRTAWNAHEWRVLFQMDDAKPWATLTGRDDPLWTEEVAEVFIDPIGDLQGYFEFEINPLATVTDLVLRRTRSGWLKDFTWHAAGIESCVRSTTTGWEAELSIPFAAIVPAPPVIGQLWRVNFLRIDRPLGPATEADLSAWSPTGLRTFHRPASFGVVEFGASEL